MGRKMLNRKLYNILVLLVCTRNSQKLYLQVQIVPNEKNKNKKTKENETKTNYNNNNNKTKRNGKIVFFCLFLYFARHSTLHLLLFGARSRVFSQMGAKGESE